LQANSNVRNEEIDNQQALETPDEAALNEEASRELAAMVAEVESGARESSDSRMRTMLSCAPQSQANVLLSLKL
jgi:hypothetical protein